MSTGPTNSLSLGNLPQLVKASSDPSIATNQDNLERDVELNNLGEGLIIPPPYTVNIISIYLMLSHLLLNMFMWFFGAFQAEPSKHFNAEIFISFVHFRIHTIRILICVVQ